MRWDINSTTITPMTQIKEERRMKKHEIFVSPSGSDRNPGTIELPLATIEAARNLARKYKDHEQVFVNIRGGEYFGDHSISLGEQDSGKPGMPVTYRAYKNEKPVIT